MDSLKYGQNFIINREIVDNFVKQAGFKQGDLVIDIGVGKGVILNELLKYTDNAKGYELDSKLFNNLPENLKAHTFLKDFILERETSPYYIFSNIPFNNTALILEKLFNDPMFKGGYLVMQREAYFKYAGEVAKKGNSMQSILWNSCFRISKVYDFKDIDFKPSPKVSCVLVKLARIGMLNVAFADLVAFVYENSTPTIKRVFRGELNNLGINLNVGASGLTIAIWEKIYNFLVKSNSKILRASSGSYLKNRRISKGIEKSHRTRFRYN